VSRRKHEVHKMGISKERLHFERDLIKADDLRKKDE
jgi:hypothetical protein